MRDSWSEYFLRLAFAVSQRATCPRLHVGCVLVHRGTRSVLSTGYNGSARGEKHCEDVGCDLVEYVGEDGRIRPNCVRTAHAEANAVAQAARNGHATSGCVAYVTHQPCWPCAKLLLNAGVSKVVYAIAYRPDARSESAYARNVVDVLQVRVENPFEELERVKRLLADARESLRRCDPGMIAASASG